MGQLETCMRHSEERILTTHVGSLPRPAALSDLFLRRECGEAIDEATLASQIEAAVKDVVEKQRATGIGNAYYDSHERYVFAVARQMRKEYELIHAKGFVLQLDCPDLAMERVRMFKDAPLHVFQANVEMHIAAINEAIANIPRERVRLHVCWGNYEG